MILLEYQNIKTFLQKAMFQISLKKFLLLKVKIAVLWTSVISDLKWKEIVETFYQKGIAENKSKRVIELKK